MAKISRVPKLDLAVVLNSQNPQIDLRLDAYEVSTRNFIRAVSSYTQRALTEITNRKNAHLSARKRLSEKIQQVETETNQCKLREIELIKVLDSENEERREAEVSVASFRRQLAVIKEKCVTLDAELEQHRVVVADLHRERDSERSILQLHAARVMPELVGSEAKLGCRLEGIDKDKILVRFVHVDAADSDREYSLVLDVSARSYKVPTMTPVLPTMPIHLSELNETRDTYAFIKNVRQAFVQLASGSNG